MAQLPKSFERRPSVLLSVVCYLLWFVLSGAILWLVFQVRGLLVAGMMWLRFNPWAVRAFDRWGIFLLGMIALVAIFWLEGYLRSGVEQGRFWPRAGWFVLIFGAVAALALAGEWLI
ncbi:MAG TPA: hypothetical protein VNK95_15115 [Caldilineaceae bacterium]|nr:hypothetical protein [Caldilineaceae bacterium]